MKDVMGNELRVGDLVALQLERPLILGRVTEAAEGGMVTGINHKGAPEIRPGRLLITSFHPVEFDPRLPVRAVMALRDDNALSAPSIAQIEATEKPN